MRKVANRAGVQPATMTRLAKEMACDSYTEFKRPFQQQLRDGPGQFSGRARLLHDRGAAGETARLVDEIMACNAANLTRTFSGLATADLEAAASDLDAARRIFAVGMRKCFPLAFFFAYTCRMLHKEAMVIDGGHGTFVDELSAVQGDDVMIAFGFDPYTRETVRAVETAKRQGARLIAVTDTRVSPLAVAADHCFLVANTSPGIFRSLSAAMAVCETLLAVLVARGREENVDALAESERRLDEFGIYWRRQPDQLGAR